MKKQIERTILHIRDLERRLGEVDNNLRYIKVVQALKKSMDNLYILLLDTALQREYQSTYMVYFYGVAFHFIIKSAALSWSTRTATDLSNYTFLYF
jgi:hypothetical protein